MVRAANGKRTIFKKKKEPVEMINRHFQLFSGDFVWGVLQLYEGVLIGKLVAYK
jgi:hypothetical protein